MTRRKGEDKIRAQQNNHVRMLYNGKVGIEEECNRTHNYVLWDTSGVFVEFAALMPGWLGSCLLFWVRK